MRMGIIQTRGIGDIVIAAPIASYWIAQGHEVLWPIDAEFLPAFAYALPEICFIPVEKAVTGARTAEFFVEFPRRVLAEHGCARIHTLYSYITGYDFGHESLFKTVSFDNYKYLVAGVPLSEKWKLRLRRNPLREAALFGRLGLSPSDDYVVCHERGDSFRHDFSGQCHDVFPGKRMVRIEPLTDSFLDWLGVIECCRAFFGVNSAYSNLVDQLGFGCEKYFKCQTPAQWTPVFANKWVHL